MKEGSDRLFLNEIRECGCGWKLEVEIKDWKRSFGAGYENGWKHFLEF